MGGVQFLSILAIVSIALRSGAARVKVNRGEGNAQTLGGFDYTCKFVCRFRVHREPEAPGLLDLEFYEHRHCPKKKNGARERCLGNATGCALPRAADEASTLYQSFCQTLWSGTRDACERLHESPMREGVGASPHPNGDLEWQQAIEIDMRATAHGGPKDSVLPPAVRIWKGSSQVGDTYIHPSSMAEACTVQASDFVMQDLRARVQNSDHSWLEEVVDADDTHRERKEALQALLGDSLTTHGAGWTFQAAVNAVNLWEKQDKQARVLAFKTKHPECFAT